MDKEYNRDNYIFSFSISAIAFVMYSRNEEYKEKVDVEILKSNKGYIYAIANDEINNDYYTEYKESKSGLMVECKYYNHMAKILRDLVKRARSGYIDVREIDLDLLDAE